MAYELVTAAPHLAATAFVRGERHRTIALSEFRGSWVVVSYAARHRDVLELAELEESFAADGAIVLATTPDDLHETADRYADEPVRFPILTGVAESRRITMIVDPGGVVRHVGLPRSAREVLASLERLLAAQSPTAAQRLTAAA
jgi:peroxiredoxin